MMKFKLSASRGVIEINGKDFDIRHVTLGDTLEGGFMYDKLPTVMTANPSSTEFLDLGIEILQRYIKDVARDDLLTLDFNQFYKLLLFIISDASDIDSFFKRIDELTAIEADSKNVLTAALEEKASPVKSKPKPRKKAA